MSLPELHFAHANGLPSACYRKMLDRLRERFTVHAVPALGTDPRYPVDANWRSLTEQVAASIRERASGPVVGVGHSMGGLTTFMAAHRHPELFRGVVILDPPVVNGATAVFFAAMKAIGQADRITPAGKSRNRRERFASRDEARARLGGKALFRAFDPECFEDYLRHGFVDDDEGGVRLAIPVATEVAIFRTSPVDGYRYRTPLRVPGALLAGETSDVTGHGFDERLARRHGLVHTVVPGGHMFPLERPIETARDVVAAIDALGVL